MIIIHHAVYFMLEVHMYMHRPLLMVCNSCSLYISRTHSISLSLFLSLSLSR